MLKATLLIAVVTLASATAGVGIQHFLHDYQTVPPGIELQDVDPWALTRELGEDDLSFASRLNQAVFTSTYHCKPGEFSLTWLQAMLSPTAERRLFLRWTEGLLGDDLVCGFCHQRSINLAFVMRSKGFPDAWAYGVNGHVVVKFSINSSEYAVDPDYGIGPFPLPNDEQKTMETALVAYRDFGNADAVASMFTSKSDNAPYGSPQEFAEVQRHRDFFFRATNWIAGALVALSTALFALTPRLGRLLSGRSLKNCLQQSS